MNALYLQSSHSAPFPDAAGVDVGVDVDAVAVAVAASAASAPFFNARSVCPRFLVGSITFRTRDFNSLTSIHQLSISIIHPSFHTYIRERKKEDEEKVNHTRKPPIRLPIPEDRPITTFCGSTGSRENSNSENTPRARNQCDLTDICVECREEFLGELLYEWIELAWATTNYTLYS